MVIGWFVVSSARAEEMRARFRIRSRHWAPPQWNQRRPTGPVIDVTARPVDPPTDPWTTAPRSAEPQRVS
jgi:hypothetical protein